ncbi:hypothetical protein HSB1_00050 [Halogranum salarium B-1]|uniref:Uncharacterized protein n=1 Tax=Halogranum salarium B-1 TaxID=1210908 RepID=J3A7N7_9EURY|nr:hypothetical protein HSB1_00050 [Halogranum salarium B-1]
MRRLTRLTRQTLNYNSLAHVLCNNRPQSNPISERRQVSVTVYDTARRDRASASSHASDSFLLTRTGDFASNSGVHSTSLTLLSSSTLPLSSLDPFGLRFAKPWKEHTGA